ncbi:prolyl oligopeptidase family serine peptidase [Flavobacterium sp. Fl-77]|uniref:Prolyl oligopeptidase family serine peptidase n=1 Tax=Flavobacterium flavipigmentatum TaxID=2893884 RepID=A0AAJ2SBR1_9FLAO|nr:MULTISPECIES: prolyl oligopeptidase family serine peptidase [unclassified Flavobacterium]MDX6183680.1 prolyl oligopeptidase family serine peptidase [Flavobacterium sp. Fl-33]MDX6187232.1 prolyl oligopeptidase family serine peptidase [Flavobacterium sp. Fl-77]UFH37958.1 prolyl oligopeptidase family serine peptidase [Flavobacterium sp. F-70]
MTKNIFILSFLFFSITGISQNLKLEEIMKGESFIGNQPTYGRWSLDGKKVYFEWNPKDELGNSTYYWQKGMTQPAIADPKEAVFSKLNFKRKPTSDIVYYLDKGALYSYVISTKSTKKMIQQSTPISNIELGNEAGIVFFEQNNNLFKYNTKEGTVLQITNFAKGIKKAKAPEKESFLKDQQKELFQFIKDKEARKQWNLAKSKAVKSDFAKEFFYGEDNLYSLKVNPNGKFATFSLVEERKTKKEKMEVFITEDGYNQTPETKDKVSIDNFVKTKFAIYSVAKDSVYYVNFSSLSHIQDTPKYYEEYDKLKNKAKEDRWVVAQEPVYNEDGSLAIVEIRSQDNKDRWLVSLNLENGTFQEIEQQHDDAWIGGPGIPSYAFDSGNIGFLADNETVYFQSEATGYSHLYSFNLKTKKKTQLTKGNWEVRDLALSKDKKVFYLTTNTTHPGNRNFYKLAVADGILQPILTKDGAHEVVISPDEKSLLVRYSYKNKPWDFYIAENKNNAVLQQISSSTSEKFNNYKWREAEVITFKAQDGTPVNARLYTPKTENANKAAIIFVHGAGYLQNAHNYWSTYFREYMFHNLLTDLGYTVLDIDYRGSDGYGRDFRTGIYRFMGGKDLSDQIDGKKYLVDKYGIDADRVGIYGGSYGGFITLMGMLTTPGEFKSGAALRSVTDWAHYNHGYTGNILNFPETDPQAYKKSSPIYFADNLKGNLVMLHGMVDDNVEYKDIVRLSQRFIELEKKNWTLASFPVEAHGFKETYSWIDEYSRILNLFNSTLLKP